MLLTSGSVNPPPKGSRSTTCFSLWLTIMTLQCPGMCMGYTPEVLSCLCWKRCWPYDIMAFLIIRGAGLSVPSTDAVPIARMCFHTVSQSCRLTPCSRVVLILCLVLCNCMMLATCSRLSQASIPLSLHIPRLYLVGGGCRASIIDVSRAALGGRLACPSAS